MRVLHAIHDFLPRHVAGSEVYALNLCQELGRRHDVYVLCAEYDSQRAHGSVHWRVHEGLPVVEVVNNWHFGAFADTYQSPLMNARLESVLQTVQPDVLHIHNLLNLSMDLPVLARRRGIPSVATLHDYTLVCPSGGQRVHLSEEHVCEVIEVARCSRCFPESPFFRQMAGGPASAAARLASVLPGGSGRLLRMAAQAATARKRASPLDISRRLDKVKQVFASVDLFVSPSPALAAEYVRLGLPAGKLHVSDYGFSPGDRDRSSVGRRPSRPLRIGFVGTLVWHKGAHVLIEAARRLPAGTFELKLFGDPDVFPDYVASLRALADGCGARFMGRFDPSEMRRVYAEVDVLVVPSLWMENSPLVIHEAFLAGIPVVGARTGGISDLVTDGVNGLLYDAFSADALATALGRLIEDLEYARTLGAGAPPIRTIDEDARGWEGIYDRVVRHPAVRSAS